MTIVPIFQSVVGRIEQDLNVFSRAVSGMWGKTPHRSLFKVKLGDISDSFPEEFKSYRKCDGT